MARRKVINLLNSILWDQTVNKNNKNKIYETIVKSITLYSSEVMTFEGKKWINSKRGRNELLEKNDGETVKEKGH